MSRLYTGVFQGLRRPGTWRLSGQSPGRNQRSTPGRHAWEPAAAATARVRGHPDVTHTLILAYVHVEV